MRKPRPRAALGPALRVRRAYRAAGQVIDGRVIVCASPSRSPRWGGARAAGGGVMRITTDAHDPRAPVKARSRRKTPTPPQLRWGGSEYERRGMTKQELDHLTITTIP